MSWTKGCEMTTISQGNIGQALRGERETAGGFRWKYQ